MRNRLTLIVAALSIGCMSIPVLAADPATPPAPASRPAGAQRGQRGGGPGRDALAEAVAVVGELNLAPDFNLTAEQKQKIQTIRDDFKKQKDAWTTDHAQDLKALDDQMAALRTGGQNNRDDFQKVMQSRRELMATAPKSDDAAKAIQAVLTDDEAKLFTAKQAEVDKERQDAMNRFGGGQGGQGGRGGRGGNGGGNGGGGGGGAGGGGQGGNQNAK